MTDPKTPAPSYVIARCPTCGYGEHFGDCGSHGIPADTPLCQHGDALAACPRCAPVVPPAVGAGADYRCIHGTGLRWCIDCDQDWSQLHRERDAARADALEDGKARIDAEVKMCEAVEALDAARARIAEVEAQAGAMEQALLAFIVPVEAFGIAYADKISPEMQDSIAKARSLAIPALSAWRASTTKEMP